MVLTVDRVTGHLVEPSMVIAVPLSATPKLVLTEDYVMAARRIVLTDSRRSRPVRRKLKIASGAGIPKVMNLCDARRMKKTRASGRSLQGRGYPDDHLVGPDEPGHELLGHFTGLNLFGWNMPVGPHDPVEV